MIAGVIDGPTYKHSFNDGDVFSSLELAFKTARNFVVTPCLDFMFAKNTPSWSRWRDLHFSKTHNINVHISRYNQGAHTIHSFSHSKTLTLQLLDLPSTA